MLEVKNLSQQFVLHMLQGQTIEAFNNINFTVKRGELLSLAGASGSGKSSIMKCIYRTNIANTGQVLFTDKQQQCVDILQLKEHEVIELRRTKLGRVSQFLHVIPRVSAVDVVAEPLLYFGVDEKEARERAMDLLDRLNISKRLFNAFPSTFSGGEQQRVNVARSIIWEPSLLLLDEPTASLDPKTTQIVVDLMMDLKKKGSTMVAIFHDHDLMKSISDNILYLS